MPTTAPPKLETVKLASGQSIQVQGAEEKTWFNLTRGKYLRENRYDAVTDVQDLDRLLILELMIHRWTLWLASGLDYEGNLILEADLSKKLREYSVQITAIKDSMGLARSTRNKEEHDSVGAYIVKLKQRAREFGVHRERQLTKALILMKELSTLVGAYDRSDAEERKKIGVESEHDILQWVRDTMLPEFEAVDAHFRANSQKYWRGEL